MRYSSYDGQRAETSKTHAPSSIAVMAREMVRVWVHFDFGSSKVAEPASQPKQLQSKPLHPKPSSKHNNYNNNNKPQIKYQSIQVCHTVGATNTHWHTNKHTHPFCRPKGKSLTRTGKSLCKNQLLELPKKEQERKKERKNSKSLSFSFLCAQRKVIKGLFF